ncbi:MAG: hypothetical protein FJ304_15665 [Planctomycetes bacterium]|nr:hypothetical protein [Planctomycetota bacterium]
MMELIAGATAGALLARRGRLTWKNATRIVAAAARGLGAVHAQNLVHRDVKPSNLLVTTAGGREGRGLRPRHGRGPDCARRAAPRPPRTSTRAPTRAAPTPPSASCRASGSGACSSASGANWRRTSAARPATCATPRSRCVPSSPTRTRPNRPTSRARAPSAR